MIVTALLALAVAFQAPPQSAPAHRPGAEAQRPAAKSESELRKRGRQLLDTAEAEASGLAEAGMHGYALLQLARVYAMVDRQKAMDLLNQAFSAANSLADDSKTKPRLEQQILQAMAPMSPERVDELLPQAPAEARQTAFQALLSYYEKSKQMDRAMDVVDRIAADGPFPYTAATKLMDVLPPESAAERQRLFHAALESFRAERLPPMAYVSAGGDFGQMVVQQWQGLPQPIVRDAIAEILRKAESSDSGSMEMTMFGQSGSLAFNSAYEWRLFQLLPVLRQVDESAAEELLKKHQTLEAQFERYPQGLRSWAGDPRQPAVSGTVVTTRDSSSPRTTPPAPPPRVFQMLLMIEQMNRVLREVKEHPDDALAQALAIADDSTRLRTLILVARATQQNNTSVCRSALKTVVDQVDRLQFQDQVNLLVDAGRLYLAVGENDGVETVVERGASVAEKMYRADTNSDDPNKATKAYWPSTNAWTNFVHLAAQVSPDLALKIVNGIPEEEIRPFIRIALAASWLGAPSGSNLIMMETKSGSRTFTGPGGEEEAATQR